MSPEKKESSSLDAATILRDAVKSANGFETISRAPEFLFFLFSPKPGLRFRALSLANETEPYPIFPPANWKEKNLRGKERDRPNLTFIIDRSIVDA